MTCTADHEGVRGLGLEHVPQTLGDLIHNVQEAEEGGGGQGGGGRGEGLA